MKIYKSLKIKAKDASTDIWLADMDGNLVQKETGVMDTSLLRGKYNIHFGIKGKPNTIDLQEDLEFNE